MKSDAVSFSQLALWAKCGEAYRRRYCSQESNDQSLPAAVGQAVHKGIEAFELGYGPSLLALSQDALKAIPGVLQMPYYGVRDCPWWLTKGLRGLCANYLDHRTTDSSRLLELGEYKALEVPFAVCLTEDLPVLRGYIDQVRVGANEQRFVRDVKTGKQHGWHSVQVELYRLAWNEDHPDEPCLSSDLLYLSGTKSRLVQVPAKLTRNDLMGMLWYLGNAKRYDIFVPTGPFTGACETCEFRRQCNWGQVGDTEILLGEESNANQC